MSARPAIAASPVEEPVAATAKDKTERLFEFYYGHLVAQRYEQALAVVDQIRLDPSNKEGQAIVGAMRAAALLGLKRDKDAEPLIAAIKQSPPQQPFPWITLFEGGLIADHFDVAADAFDRLIADFPDAAVEQDRNFVRYFMQNEPKGQDRRNEDRRVALARIGYGANAEDGDWITAGAVEILTRRGDFPTASQFLPHILEPQAIENMLIQKRYAPLWPQLVQLGGPHLDKVRVAAVAKAEKAYANAPGEQLAGYVDALRHAGRLSDAIALKAKLPQTESDMSAGDEKMGWAVNSIAYSLHQVGRADEADQLMALLNDAPLLDDGWRISMKINRLEMLVAGGEFAKALPLIEPTAKLHGSKYADQLVRRLRYCTLSGLGRKDEAAKLLPDLVAHAEDAAHATVDALLCGGEVDKAEQVALAALKNADANKKAGFEEDFVRALQPVALTSDDASVWDQRWNELRKRPSIAREYDRLGRDMPADFLPSKAVAAAP